jgi:6-phosphofructo-2-kinase / fructose-2,6-biphosphatase 2
LNRAAIEARVAKEPGLTLLFLESTCDDPEVIAANIALKVSSGDPDYKNMSRKAAEADFRRRIQEYHASYQTIDEPHLSYLKIINVGAQIIMNHINGYLQSRIAYYLMNLHLKPRSIFFSRVGSQISFLYMRKVDSSSLVLKHGESVFNVEGKIGGDAPLSPRGVAYADALPALITDNIGVAPLTVSLSPWS